MTSRVLFGLIATAFDLGPPTGAKTPGAKTPGVRTRGVRTRGLRPRPALKVSALAVLGLTVLGMAAKAEPRASEPRAVIELFTSQGCSSCPAADKLLSQLQSDPSLIPLSLAIDYWDYLGWKDTLAVPGHSNRQRAYSQMRGDREIYTPQAVINGVTQAIGSDLKQIESAVARSYVNNSPLSVPVEVTVTDERISVTIPQHDDAVGSEVWLCPVSAQVSVGIERGENRGRTITYTNVVRRWIRLGTWNGQSETFTVPVDAIKLDGVDTVAVILQNGSAQQPGAIVGASLTALN
ncbi:MAG: DUF1223 domain-containing protein [Bradyrhizobiaceae bacterium]|nr:DUF1223 domain-containing protein [Bradyrhizobiaceae bacterium]